MHHTQLGCENVHLLNLPGVEGAGICLLVCTVGGGVLKVIVLQASNIQLISERCVSWT